MVGKTLIVAVLLMAGLLVGCAGVPRSDATIRVAPGAYGGVFDAARTVLADYNFYLERVDARGGVITTQPKGTVGLATPWDREQSSLKQEWSDLTNQQERVVRISFEPVGGVDGLVDPGSPIVDLRTAGGELVGRVEVTVLRVRRPGWRLETESIRRSTREVDRSPEGRGFQSEERVVIGQDEALAARLAAAIGTER